MQINRLTSIALGLILIPWSAHADFERPTKISPPRLVVLYVPCSVNRSYLGPYNSSVNYTPKLSAFARDSVVFERHTTEAGHSGPAYASIFTGTQVFRHGVFMQPTELDDSLRLIGEVFADGGYEPFFWGAHGMANKRLNYHQGVGVGSYRSYPLESTDQLFIDVLRRLRDDPAFKALLMTNFTAGHAPYRRDNLDKFCRRYPLQCLRGPDRRKLVSYYAKRYFRLAYDFPNAIEQYEISPNTLGRLVRAIRNAYKANMNTLDTMFGDLLAAIDASGLRDVSLIAFTADHGERLYREEALFKWTHGWELAPEVLTVPLIIRAPGQGLLPGVYTGVTRSVDLLPTLASLAGLKAPQPTDADVEGVDLGPAVRREVPPPKLAAFSHTVVTVGATTDQLAELPHWAKVHHTKDPGKTWTALREGDWMFQYRNRGDATWAPAAFDLSLDPYAEENRFEPENPRHRAASERLIAYQERLRRLWHKRAGAHPLEDPTSLDALRALGYIQ